MHTPVVHIQAVAIFLENYFLENFPKITVRSALFWGKGGVGRGGGEGRGQNVLNIVALRNNLATFDSQQLATLCMM